MGENSSNIRIEEEYITNSRGLKLYTCRWLPQKAEDIKALVFICHGYAMECNKSMRETTSRLAKAGYAVYGMDYEGHGRSAGLQGYIPSFDKLVNDCTEHFMSICERPENKNKHRFLLGESMGGAVVLLLHRKHPTYWNGAVLVAPMCKIADEMIPHPVVVNILNKLAHVIPTWRIVPTNDIIESSFKNPAIREEVRANPYCYKGRPRLRTANQCLAVTADIAKKLDQVTLPFLIVHGGDDVVTDPSVSKLLYESASSKDKTFKLYPGMWHALTSAEPPENMDLVFSDIVAWLDQRSTGGDEASEIEKKEKHEDQFSGAQSH